MGDLGQDLALEGGDGRYRLTLSQDWDIWGPCGGYIASVGLVAAGAHSAFARPASYSCHFLGVAKYEPVDIEVTTLRRTKRAESVRVSITQEGNPILEALVWTIGDVDGLDHGFTSMPDVPLASTLKTFEELVPEPEWDGYPFWKNLDEKPVNFMEHEEWIKQPGGDPVWNHWIRFRPTSTFDDPFLEAARFLITLDVCMWPAASRAYAHPGPDFIAPSLDLFGAFHILDTKPEWLLIDGVSPHAGDGLVGGWARVWSERGELLASGGQQMLCRPVTR